MPFVVRTISNSENAPNIDLHSFFCSSITYEMSSFDKVHLFTLVSQTFISVELCSSSNSFLLDFPKAESLIYHGDASLNQMDPRDTVCSLSSDVMIRKCDQHLLAYRGNWDGETMHIWGPRPLWKHQILDMENWSALVVQETQSDKTLLLLNCLTVSWVGVRSASMNKINNPFQAYMRKLYLIFCFNATTHK